MATRPNDTLAAAGSQLHIEVGDGPNTGLNTLPLNLGANNPGRENDVYPGMVNGVQDTGDFSARAVSINFGSNVSQGSTTTLASKFATARPTLDDGTVEIVFLATTANARFIDQTHGVDAGDRFIRWRPEGAGSQKAQTLCSGFLTSSRTEASAGQIQTLRTTWKLNSIDKTAQ